MITNMDVTIYNRRYDEVSLLDVWGRTVLHGVHVYVDHKTAVSDNGLNCAEIYKIRIPADLPEADQYLPPDEYSCCAAGHWTIRNGDYVVLGECHTDIEKPADLKRVFKRHCKVLSWSDNRFGGLPHWRIGGE